MFIVAKWSPISATAELLLTLEMDFTPAQPKLLL